MTVVSPDLRAPSVAPRLLRRDGMADSLAILLSATVLQKGIGFARSVLFCLWLGAEQLGEWDLAFSFLMLAAPIAVLSLPGAFGRYVQYYEKRGQLRMFLERVGLVTAMLAAAAAMTIVGAAPWFSRLIFGQAEQAGLVTVAGLALLAVIGSHFVTELAIALRLQRVASGTELLNSLLFAVGGATLLFTWQRSAAAVVLAFGLASLLSALAALPWIFQSWKTAPVSAVRPGRIAFWSKIIPFAGWVWLSNWLGHLFSVADRYMLVHYSQFDSAEALGLVGQYHSSRVIPALLVAVCGLIATTLVPFLSHDWEHGDRRNVARRLNLILKLLGVGLTFVAAAILTVSPLLFRLAFQDKFDGGLAVLSWTLMYSAWWGLLAVAKTYLWCAERVRLASVAFVLGLLTNIGLNLVLLPRFGLLGAVWSTCAAHVVTLACMYVFAMGCGLRVQRGTWIGSAMPALLALGPWWALGSLAVVCMLALRGQWLFTAAEKEDLLRLAARYAGKLRSGRSTPAITPAVTETGL